MKTESPRSSKYLDYYFEVVPTIFEPVDGKFCSTVCCLICALQKNKLPLFKYVTTSYVGSHLSRAHADIFNCKEKQREIKDAITALFENKRIRDYPCSSSSGKRSSLSDITGLNLDPINVNAVKVENKTILDHNFFKKKYSRKVNRDYSVMKYYQALWIMENSRPCLMSDDVGLHRLITYLDSDAPKASRMTIARACKVVYGFAIDEIKRRIKLSCDYFKGERFVCIQGDSWTSQSLMNVFGLSASFYCTISQRMETIVLYCAPLKNGKDAIALKRIMLAVLEPFGLSPEHILQAISDAEGAVVNGMEKAFPGAYTDICLAHRLQTCIKHCFGLGNFKRDPFPAGREFWIKIRAVITHFTKSPEKNNILLQLQIEEYREMVVEKESDRPKPVGMKKPNDTRWNGYYYACLRLLRLKKFLDIYFEESEYESLYFTREEWQTLRCAAALLETFAQITTFVQYKVRSTAAAKYLLLKQLKRYLVKAEKVAQVGRALTFQGELKEWKCYFTTPLAKSFLSKARDYFDKCFGNFIECIETGKVQKDNNLLKKGELSLADYKRHLACMYFDPRFRDWAKNHHNDSFFEEMKLAAREFVNEKDQPEYLPQQPKPNLSNRVTFGTLGKKKKKRRKSRLLLL